MEVEAIQIYLNLLQSLNQQDTELIKQEKQQLLQRLQQIRKILNL